MNAKFVRRRIGVCGSSRDLPPRAIDFCRALGACLAREPNIVVVSSGAKKKRNAEGSDNYAADWWIVHAVERALPKNQLTERIETVLNEERKDERFELGTVRRTRGKDGESRRYSFVRGLDGLLAIAGRNGTHQELKLAFELGVTVLPVPFFGGTAAEFWGEYRSELAAGLRLDDATAERWSRALPAVIEGYEPFATELVSALIDSVPRRCFVIMPFAENYRRLYDEAIEPAIRNRGDIPLRLDCAAVPGDVGQQIHDGIRDCDYAIAVLDGLRPNVLYELGLANGRGKPTILLNQSSMFDRERDVPFDLAMQQRLEYELVDSALAARLENSIATVTALQHRWRRAPRLDK